MFLFCFKGVCAKDDGSAVSLFLKWSCVKREFNRFKTSKQGLEKGVIRERDTPSDLLQHLAEFQANSTQLSHFESKPVWFRRLHVYLLDISSNPPPCCAHIFKQKGWDMLSVVVGFHLP